MSKWWQFREPTPDETLVDDIKAAVENLTNLSAEAKRRGITVWVRTNRTSAIRPEDLSFDEAYRLNREKFA